MNKDREEHKKFIEFDVQIDQKYLEKFTSLMKDVTVEIRYDFEKGALDILAKPKVAKKLPAVIILHDMWGLNDHVKVLCHKLARHGYAVLAVDLFRGNVTNLPHIAKEFLNRYSPEEDMDIIKSRFEKLMSKDYVAKDKVAFVGLLSGGYYALLAASQLKLAGTVCFYGRFPEDLTQEQIRKIKCPVLCFMGGKGNTIYRENMKELQKGFKRYGIDARNQIYENAKPPFFDDLHLETYDKESADDAWFRLLAFLEERFTDKAEADTHSGLLGVFKKLLDSAF
ncbi:MAG: dienelactone hydrolase family protein [Candidatus Omnitrophica bacterium]|nr:dienelactone hydrolase family protein [Candidatus Omnitrophota bacterium]